MSNDKIVPTEEEKKRFAECMEKPEFREMLFDYMKEIQDPKNKSQYEEEIKKYEKQLFGLYLLIFADIEKHILVVAR